VRRALSERPDIAEARTNISIGDTNIKLSRNATLPDVRLQATYLTNGLGGSRLLRSGGFPGEIVGTENTSFGTVLGQVFRSDFPTWTVGATLSYPIGKSAEEANLARVKIERDQAEARLRDVELTAVREVREAALRVEQNRQRIETAGLGRELAEQRLDAEQKRFEVGMSTSFLVIQAQRDLAVARNNELQASLEYQLALVAFQAAQVASAPR
jgi:outer membrane protein